MKQPKLAPLFLLSSLLLAACAHEKKVNDPLRAAWRVEDHGPLTTGMPNFVLSPDAYTAATATKSPERAIASGEDMIKELESSDKKPSLRRLYFRTLYQQFKTFNAAGVNKLTLKSCPSFHNDRLLIDEDSTAPVALSMAPARPEMTELAYYPEWLLPVRKAAHAPSVWSNKSTGPALMKKGLSVHHAKIHRELKTLCETGESDAYFRLENMVTYFGGKPELQERNGLRAMLKIPAFSTMLLLKAVQAGPNADFSVHDRRLLEEVHGMQFEQYVRELRKHRFSSTTGAL